MQYAHINCTTQIINNKKKGPPKFDDNGKVG